MVVADSTVFIALAKIGRLDVLRHVYTQVLMTPAVKHEVIDAGRQISAFEVSYIESGVSQGWIKTIDLAELEQVLALQIQARSHLHKGEAESMAVASSRDLPLVVDDKEARAMAQSIGVEYLGTAALLLKAFILGYMDFEELSEAVRDLAEVIWLSPAVVAEILRRAREV